MMGAAVRGLSHLCQQLCRERGPRHRGHFIGDMYHTGSRKLVEEFTPSRLWHAWQTYPSKLLARERINFVYMATQMGNLVSPVPPALAVVICMLTAMRVL